VACWLDARAAVGESSIDGCGLFAATAIDAGEVVARLGGRVVTTDELSRCFAAAATAIPPRYVDTITVDDDEHLILPAGAPVHFLNHSCEPNLWHEDTFMIAARRAIDAGEELTIDYATHSGLPDFRMPCRCGSPSCRGEVTGDDWRRPELQARYGAHWVRGLRRRIASHEPDGPATSRTAP
jgi:SET domain-containing protein